MNPVSAPRRRFARLILLVGLVGIPIMARGEERAPIKFADTQYQPVDWADLEGWSGDDHAAAFATFLVSCRTLTGRQRSGRELAAIPAAVRFRSACRCSRSSICSSERRDRCRSCFTVRRHLRFPIRMVEA